MEQTWGKEQLGVEQEACAPLKRKQMAPLISKTWECLQSCPALHRGPQKATEATEAPGFADAGAPPAIRAFGHVAVGRGFTGFACVFETSADIAAE